MAKFGVAALEDDAIYVAVIEGDRDGFGKLANVHQYARPSRGYSNEFIKQTIHKHFAPLVASREITCLGISSFGLLDLGGKTLLQVPRWDWRDDQPLRYGELFNNFPLHLAHDSSAAAVGELRLWQARQPNYGPTGYFVRIRVGSGVGVGCVDWEGRPRVGNTHPEAGHLPVRRRNDDSRGTCRVHSQRDTPWDCIEGLISEQALLKRSGAQCLEAIPAEHEVWDTVAELLARLVCAITTLMAPDVIVIGGRTMIDSVGKPRENVLGHIRTSFATLMGDYPRYEATRDMKSFIIGSRIMINPASASLFGMAHLTHREFRHILGRSNGPTKAAGT